MIPDHLKACNASLQQSQGISFNFIQQNDKLIINAVCSRNNITYLGQLLPTPLIDLETIKEILEQGQYKTTIRNNDIFKIKIGPMFIEMAAQKNNSQIEHLKDEITKSLQKQEQLEQMIRQQRNENIELKSVIEILRLTLEEFKTNVVNEINQHKSVFLQHKAQIEKQQIYIEQINRKHPQIQLSIKQLKMQMESMKKQYTFQQTSKIPVESAKQQNQKINISNLPVASSNSLLTGTGTKLYPNISQAFSPSIQSMKWSQKMKSTKIKIDGKKVERIGQYIQFESQFVLTDASFTHNMRTKTRWAVKIIKKSCGIDVGLCLRNAMQKTTFSIQYFKWKNIGHGCYLISSDKQVYSHSVKEVNSTKKGFEFGQGDVIYMEYDPIEWKLRFCKNNSSDKVQMSIDPPTADDAYHPCISFCYQNDSAQLMYSGTALS